MHPTRRDKLAALWTSTALTWAESWHAQRAPRRHDAVSARCLVSRREEGAHDAPKGSTTTSVVGVDVVCAQPRAHDAVLAARRAAAGDG